MISTLQKVSQSSTKSWILGFLRKSGSGPCSNRYNTLKNKYFFKSQKNLENLILDLSFAVGFIKIHNLARFLEHFEVG